MEPSTIFLKSTSSMCQIYLHLPNALEIKHCTVCLFGIESIFCAYKYPTDVVCICKYKPICQFIVCKLFATYLVEMRSNLSSEWNFTWNDYCCSAVNFPESDEGFHLFSQASVCIGMNLKTSSIFRVLLAPVDPP